MQNAVTVTGEELSVPKFQLFVFQSLLLRVHLRGCVSIFSPFSLSKQTILSAPKYPLSEAIATAFLLVLFHYATDIILFPHRSSHLF